MQDVVKKKIEADVQFMTMHSVCAKDLHDGREFIIACNACFVGLYSF